MSAQAHEIISQQKQLTKIIDLVQHPKIAMLDIVMPRMGGRDAYRELPKIAPHVKVIFCSGFTRDASVGKLIYEGVQGGLSKLHHQAELSRQLAEALTLMQLKRWPS